MEAHHGKRKRGKSDRKKSKKHKKKESERKNQEQKFREKISTNDFFSKMRVAMCEKYLEIV